MTAAAETVSGGVAAVVLAAGRSSRMGALKPLLTFGSQTALAHVVASLRVAGIAPVCVVVGHRADELLAAIAAAGAVAVVNAAYDDGMMTSVKAGIAALPADVAGCLVLPVDIPLVRPATLARLAAAGSAGAAAVVHPNFLGKRGHPPFLARRIFAEIAAAPPALGLRDVLARHEAEAVDLAVFDAACLRDMDYPDDYLRLAEAAGHRRHPDADECEAMLAAAGTDERTRRHCRAVARLARRLADRLIAAGLPLDAELVEAGARLHDIAKSETAHATAGALLVAGFGFPEVARIVAAHMEMAFEPGDDVDERAVVLLADKLIREETQVGLERRFAPVMTRFAEAPEALAGARRRHAAAAAILAAVEDLIGPVDAPDDGDRSIASGG